LVSLLRTRTRVRGAMALKSRRASPTNCLATSTLRCDAWRRPIHSAPTTLRLRTPFCPRRRILSGRFVTWRLIDPESETFEGLDPYLQLRAGKADPALGRFTP